MSARMRRFGLTLAALLLLAAPAVPAATADLEQSLESLRRAAAGHPKQPDYSWALAEALEAAGRDADAAQQMRAHLKRWPDRPGHGWRALGRCEYRAGRFEPARDALRKAVARDPRDAEAQLYLGLALQALGQPDHAEGHLEMAASLDPALAGDALLLAGVSQLSRGNTDRARVLLERVIETSPHSDSAREARLLMGRRSPAPLRLEAYSGFAYDSNATLEGGSDLPGDRADDDFQLGFGTRIGWRPALAGESRPLELSALYERIDYLAFDEFSTQRTAGIASWRIPLHERVALRVSAGGDTHLEQNSLYLWSAQVSPQLYVALGGRRGVLRLHGSGERLEYDDQAFPSSLERDGWTYGGGFEHSLPLWGERRGTIGWGGSYSRRDTQAQRDAQGFEGAYDRDRWRVLTRARFELPLGVRAYADVRVDAELFDHRNLADRESGASQSAPAARRRDLVASTTLSLRRDLLQGIELELVGGYEDHDSNVDVYRYRRGVAGMRLHAAFP